jgi:hypothetical protein
MKLIIAIIVALLLYLWKTGQSITSILGGNIPGVAFGQGATLGSSPGSMASSSYATIGHEANPQGVQSIPVPATQRVVNTFQAAPVFKPAIGVNQITAQTTPTPVKIDAAAPFGRMPNGTPYTQKINWGPVSTAAGRGSGYSRL